MSRNLVKQWENEQILAEIEEKREEIEEIQQFESDAEYGLFDEDYDYSVDAKGFCRTSVEDQFPKMKFD